jgi:hypothetical protein
VAEKSERGGGSRYGTIIATFVGFLALCVSGYTAYMQRQQVRAMVWPILQFDSSNAPDIHFTLANKGVGPAIIQHVIVRVDGKPFRNWHDIFEKLLGPGEHHGSESDMSNRVLTAGEVLDIMTPHRTDGDPIKYDRSDPVWQKWNDERFKVTIEICYSSTLGECWTLRAGGRQPNVTTECRTCPTPSEISFQQ